MKPEGLDQALNLKPFEDLSYFVEHIEALDDIIRVDIRNAVFANAILSQACDSLKNSSKPQKIIARMGAFHLKGVKYLIEKAINGKNSGISQISVSFPMKEYSELTDEVYENRKSDLIKANVDFYLSNMK